MNPVTKDNVRRRLRAVEGEVAHLRTQVEQAYDGRNKMLSEKVIAPAMTEMQQVIVASRAETVAALSEMEARVSTIIDEKMKDVWTALSGLTKVVTSLADRMDAVDKEIDEMQTDINDLVHETEVLETRLDEIDASPSGPKETSE